MECPTCFQKIIVPQAPTEEQKFIITGTKVGGERPASSATAGSNPIKPVASKSFPGALIVVIILIFIGLAVAFVYRGTIFKEAHAPAMPTNTVTVATPPIDLSPPPGMVAFVATNLPVPAETNYWTLDINSVGTPNVPAGGKVHGKRFKAARMLLNSDGLTIRTADLPPEAGVTIYLRTTPLERLYNKSLVFETNTPGSPTVSLRWKNAQGREVDEARTNGYALRIEFGNPVNNHVPGKVYLCAPDELNSYVVGNFNAEIKTTRR